MSAVLTGEPAGVGERLARQFLRVWDDPDTGPAMRAVLRGAASHDRSATLAREFFGRGMFRRIAAALDLPEANKWVP